MLKEIFKDPYGGKTLTLGFLKPNESVEIKTLHCQGIDAYIVTDSEEEQQEIVSCVDNIIHGSGIIKLTIDDVRNILSGCCRFFYSSLVGHALKDALDDASKDLSRKGIDVSKAKRLLIRIGMPVPEINDRNYVSSQLMGFVAFQSELSENYNLKFCIMCLDPCEDKGVEVSVFALEN